MSFDPPFVVMDGLLLRGMDIVDQRAANRYCTTDKVATLNFTSTRLQNWTLA